MNNLKFLHIGDMHIDHDFKSKAKIQPSLDQIINYCKEIKINAVVVPGDLTHRKQSYSGSSGVPMLINFLKDLSRLVDFIFITKGNHDEPGSIALLHQLKENIYSFEFPVVMGVIDRKTHLAIDILREKSDFKSPDYVVSLVPYPTKASLLIEDSIDNNNAEFIQKFEQIFEHIGNVTQSYTCPKILGFHGNIVGSRLSSGQTLMSQDIVVAPSTLEKAKHDYYALNHIHAYQEINPCMFYAGGTANFNWGETEQKSFQVITFEDGEMNVERVMLTSARPMQKIDAVFTCESFKFDGIAIPNAETRFRITLNENERNLLTDEKLGWIRKEYGDDVKIELNIIPIERDARSETIMTAKDLLQEVIEYAKIIEHKVDNGVMAKVAALQEKGVEAL